jgi:hypothetical protein
MTPENSPQLHGLPSGSGSTKQIPAEVEHLELACATLLYGAGSAGASRTEGNAAAGGVRAFTVTSPSPASAKRGSEIVRMRRMSDPFMNGIQV